MKETWQSGNAYDRFMGRWSTRVALKFLSWLDAAPSSRWLDVGCGTGTLTKLILENNQPTEVIALDSSAEFIEHARQTITDPRVSFRVGLAQALDLESASIDVAVSGLVLNFVPEPKAAIAEMLRVTRPGGKIGVFVWDYASGMQMLRYFWDAVIELDPSTIELDEGPRFPICQEGQLEAYMLEMRLAQIESAVIEVETVFQDFDDYWHPFLGGVGPASNYVLNIDVAHRQRLKEKLQELLPYGPDGKIPLWAKAWAVKGIVDNQTA